MSTNQNSNSNPSPSMPRPNEPSIITKNGNNPPKLSTGRPPAPRPK